MFYISIQYNLMKKLENITIVVILYIKKCLQKQFNINIIYKNLKTF